ncbi:MAG: glutaredoxin, partial [Actinomycetia bacterium]|nr:glutaredoxin [Actinomycetes bacterium]
MTDETGTTVVYWRRMCGFCTRLLGALEGAGVDVELR